MNCRAFAGSLITLALFGVLSCSFVVDTSDIDRGCGPGKKLCGTGNCVLLNDPAYGCTRDNCEPCALTNAIPECAGETCAVKACLLGFGCPNEAGCPANLLVEPANCGLCNFGCAANESCQNGACVAD